MQEFMNYLDWAVIVLYLIALIFFSVYLSRGQHSREDYYVGGGKLGAWPVAISTMATQCSTNSILGAPAFVAFAAGGGLVWLQYELAVPLAMIAIMIFIFPIFHRLKLISVYEYLENRFDLKTRLVMSTLFQFVRAFATGVTVYSIALVIELITGISFFWSVCLLGVVTVVYDVLGGVKAVVYSDVIQMLVLVCVLLLVLFLLTEQLGGWSTIWQDFSATRREALDFKHHGLGDGQTFAFWPMLFGGFFLYVSYYGCDQSQMQRELCVKNIDQGNKALFLNGVLRFPIVLLYCFVGMAIGVFAINQPEFLNLLPRNNETPNYNLAVPAYMLSELPHGVIGLGMVALFAAAMSSLDSVINSLSAVTMEDFVRRFKRTDWSEKRELMISRVITVFWGVLTLTLAFYVGDIAPTVIEAINKIGSLVNGPILGVFALGLLTCKASGRGAILGLIIGFLTNLMFWVFLPSVSWLWWNVIGFIITFLIGLLVFREESKPSQVLKAAGLVWTYDLYKQLNPSLKIIIYCFSLILAFCSILWFLFYI